MKHLPTALIITGAAVLAFSLYQLYRAALRYEAANHVRYHTRGWQYGRNEPDYIEVLRRIADDTCPNCNKGQLDERGECGRCGFVGWMD